MKRNRWAIVNLANAVVEVLRYDLVRAEYASQKARSELPAEWTPGRGAGWNRIAKCKREEDRVRALYDDAYATASLAHDAVCAFIFGGG